VADCHARLEALLISLRGGGSVVYRSLSQALYTLTAVATPGAFLPGCETDSNAIRLEL